MKIRTAGGLLFVLILGFSSMAHAYSFSFGLESGGISLHVAENSSLISIVTTNDLIADLDFGTIPQDVPMKYTASVDMTLGLFGMFDYELELGDLALGTFEGINPEGIIPDGTSTLGYVGTSLVTTQLGQYSLAGATLDYDVTFTPDQEIADRYAISIDTLSLYGGNTSELLSAIINDLNQSGQSPLVLTVPFTVPMTLSGTIDIEADPVPVPAALWLFGTGLLGLIGFKNRKNK